MCVYVHARLPAEFQWLLYGRRDGTCVGFFFSVCVSLCFWQNSCVLNQCAVGNAASPKVNWTRGITVGKVLNVNLVVRWNQTARRVPQPLIMHVVKALAEELGVPAAPAAFWVMLMTWLHKGTVCFNYGRVLGSWLLLCFSVSLIFLRLLPQSCFLSLAPLAWAL